VGAIPQLYDTYLVPMLFEPYAQDLVYRLKSRMPARILEIAAGTGVVTRTMVNSLPDYISIVATDLNEAMLNQARQIGTRRQVQWQQADAMQLPFEDSQFDAVICQFGVMFFPDKAKAYAEVHRVLKRGGLFLFNVWDSVEQNDFAHVVTQALATVFPDNPPRFMARTPHGYHDHQLIADDLRQGGFSTTPSFEIISKISKADSAAMVAMAYCQGTPLRNEIEARDASRMEEATRAAETALVKRFGDGPVSAKIQAHVVSIER
jgi:SAM-dependent methyltransferase